MKIISACPLCHADMRFDLILKDGRGVNASPAKDASPKDIAGYGFYCEHCGRGWTGDQLMQMDSENRNPS